MKRLSPRVFALSLAVALLAAIPASAATPESAYGDPLAPVPGAVNAGEELDNGADLGLLSTGSISVTWGGHGHGIGMPQWGAQQMASSQGKNHEQILQYFYEGAQFGKTDLEGGTIKQLANPVVVGIAQSENWVQFRPQGGSATICFGQGPDDCTNYIAANGETWLVGRYESNCWLKKMVGTAEIEVAHTPCTDPPKDSQGKQSAHGIQFAKVSWSPQPDVKILFPQFPSARDTYARGTISFLTAPSGFIHTRVALPLEEYLYGLGEVPNSWHSEALKAQVVAARSFALYKISAAQSGPDGLRVDCGCHLMNTTADQAYRGWDPDNGLTEAGSNGAKWKQAVDDTRGKAMWHPWRGNTRAIEAYYSASTGGATENNLDRWPGGGTAYPYLRSKPDPGARYETVTYSATDFASRLGFPGGVLQVQIPERYDSQRPKKVVVTGKTASGQQVVKEFTSGQFKSALKYAKGDWVKTITGVTFIDGPVPGAVVLHQQATARWFRFEGGQIQTVNYGRPGDIAILGDWDGDGIKTPGLYRQTDGFVYLKNSFSDGWADITYFFGRSGDIPVVGDFDGDGKDTISVYRPADGRFYIKNELNDGWAEYAFVFGKPGDIPFAGDWNGDGKDTVGLRRPSDGFVYLKNSNSAGWADISFFYGKAGDQVFAGDWDGDGKDSVGVYRPSTGKVYLRNKLSSGDAEISFEIGTGWDSLFFAPFAD